ncbi:MAG TPA: hypothetical protein VHN99_12030 [Deinococcales bacterium]|nr:hypothetical protein [Deinococcales bacterium]
MPRKPHGRRASEQPTRLLRGVRVWRVDQVFLRHVGGRIVAHVSLLSTENELRSERVFAPTTDPVAAARFIGREIAGLGNVDRAWGVRVRWAREQELIQDATLESEFVDAFEGQLEIIDDQMR